MGIIRPERCVFFKLKYSISIVLFWISGVTICLSQTSESKDSIVFDYDRISFQKLLNVLQDDFERKELEKYDWLMSIKKNIHSSTKYTDIENIFELGPDGTPLFYTTYETEYNRNSEPYILGDIGMPILSDGNDMEIGIWDQGSPLYSHQEFDDRLASGDDSELLFNRHMTMVASVILGSGVKEKAKGILSAGKGIMHDWKNDRLEAANLAAKGLLVSNHSYGIKPDDIPDWYFGKYLQISRSWDQIMEEAPYYLMVIAAGNNQNKGHNEEPVYGDANNGWDVLLGTAVSKNGLTVASSEEKWAVNNIEDAANVSSFSSLGPTDDGRIKPDLAINGHVTLAASGPSDRDYQSTTGTSVASARVSGHLLQLQEYYYQIYGKYLKAATLKSLVLHTCYDVGEIGPDYEMGWGIMNPYRSADVINRNNYSTIILEDNLSQGEVYTLQVRANEVEDLEVSLSWTDPYSKNKPLSNELNDPQPVLNNDLDIRLLNKNQVFKPWVLDKNKPNMPAFKGDNYLDPYERVSVLENPEGIFEIQVSHKDSLIHGSQNFSLIISGIQLSDCLPAEPRDFVVNKTTNNELFLSWKDLGGSTRFEVQYRGQNDTIWVTTYVTENNFSFSKLEYNVVYEFRVKSICEKMVSSPYSPVFSFLFEGKNTIPVLKGSFDKLSAKSIFPYPILLFNPIEDEILLNSNIPLPTKYRIYTETGQLVVQGEINLNSISFDKYAPGPYVLLLEHGGYVQSLLFYKQPL